MGVNAGIAFFVTDDSQEIISAVGNGVLFRKALVDIECHHRQISIPFKKLTAKTKASLRSQLIDHIDMVLESSEGSVDYEPTDVKVQFISKAEWRNRVSEESSKDTGS